MNPKCYYEPFNGKPSLAEKCKELMPRRFHGREFEIELRCDLTSYQRAAFFWHHSKDGMKCSVEQDELASWAWESSINAWARQLRIDVFRHEQKGHSEMIAHMEIDRLCCEVIFAPTDDLRNAAAHALVESKEKA